MNECEMMETCQQDMLDASLFAMRKAVALHGNGGEMRYSTRIIAYAMADKNDLAVAACDKDVSNLLLRFERMGIPIHNHANAITLPPFTKKANFRFHVLCAVKEATRDPGVTIIIYSGHGGRLPDDNGDEPRGWFERGYDSTLCFTDGQMRDDEVGELLALFPATEWVYFVCDSCHSGSMFRSAPRPVHRGFLFRHAEKITCRLGYFGGCQDKGYSDGLASGGAATLDLCEMLDDGIDVSNRYAFEGARALTIARGHNQIPTIVFQNDVGELMQGAPAFRRTE